jgi:hypothetical protein
VLGRGVGARRLASPSPASPAAELASAGRALCGPPRRPDDDGRSRLARGCPVATFRSARRVRTLTTRYGDDVGDEPLADCDGLVNKNTLARVRCRE